MYFCIYCNIYCFHCRICGFIGRMQVSQRPKRVRPVHSLGVLRNSHQRGRRRWHEVRSAKSEAAVVQCHRADGRLYGLQGNAVLWCTGMINYTYWIIMTLDVKCQMHFWRIIKLLHNLLCFIYFYFRFITTWEWFHVAKMISETPSGGSKWPSTSSR